jgi:hypothetical protein
MSTFRAPHGVQRVLFTKSVPLDAPRALLAVTVDPAALQLEVLVGSAVQPAAPTSSGGVGGSPQSRTQAQSVGGVPIAHPFFDTAFVSALRPLPRTALAQLEATANATAERVRATLELGQLSVRSAEADLESLLCALAALRVCVGLVSPRDVNKNKDYHMLLNGRALSDVDLPAVLQAAARGTSTRDVEATASARVVLPGGADAAPHANVRLAPHAPGCNMFVAMPRHVHRCMPCQGRTGKLMRNVARAARKYYWKQSGGSATSRGGAQPAHVTLDDVIRSAQSCTTAASPATA